MSILGLPIADTAGICITKAMNRPLTGGTVEAAAKPWLIPVPGMAEGAMGA